MGADGNVYVGGLLGGGGVLPGFPDVGRGPDAFIRAYDADGNELWSDAFALRQLEFVDAILVDATGVYAVGEAGFASAMQGARAGLFIRKYTHDGTVLWTEEFAFADQRVTDPSDAVIDDTGIYVSGSTGSPFAPGRQTLPFDAFVIKFDLDGNLVWSSRFGDPDVDDEATGIAINDDGLSVSGWTDGALSGQSNLGARDAFVAHFDTDGTRVWLDQFGSTANDLATDVAVTAGRVHVSGWTDGALSGQSNLGDRDAFVRTYGADGAEQWTTQFGTPIADTADAIAAGMSDIYVALQAGPTLGGEDPATGQRTYIRKYTAGGAESWTFLFGDAPLSFGAAVAVDGDAIYAAQFSVIAKLVERVDDGDGDDGGDEPCAIIEGDVVINSASDADAIGNSDGCVEIGGSLFVQNTDDVTDLRFLSGLRSVGGFVGVADNANLRSLAGLDELESIGEGLVVEGNPSLVALDNLGSLETVDGVIHIFGNPSLQQIDLPALVSAGELLIAGNDALLMVSAAQLVSIDMRLLIENNDLLHTVDLSSLAGVGSVRVRFNPALDNVIAPNLSL
ncbi:receptor L domain-containing protein [Persicimonas caeni]|uniref:hypothetical protein n=1 Tax=Persicimonas caeni TaxID=2292766 RepID=UPI00143D6D6F|nr:hypothetical protein [Persicimonas caeni]